MNIPAVVLAALALSSNFLVSARAAPLATETNVPLELTFTAQQKHDDPFNTVTLDVVFDEPDGAVRRVPAFWDGGNTWKARYASTQTGTRRWRSECNDPHDAGLHGVAGSVEVSAYTGDNPLFKHGPVRVAADKRHFEYADGTPFFWLGDTWWMGLSHRLHWPEDFKQLTADRREKGFTVVQIVAGLYPDMPPFDPRGANEAGFPWEKDYTRIRPEYFDAADRRLRHLVDQGISPCLVGAWGYFMPWMGVAKAKAHWRYLIARYAAWPCIWCAAGEANLPYYLTKGFPYDDRQQVHGWTEVLRYIRATDPWRRPLTLHPTAINFYASRHATDDPALLDFDMLQTPHGQAEAVPIVLRAMRESYNAKPAMPVVDGEASYEMLGDSLPTQWTRAMFWLCMTGGAAGHTYGANGIWQVNRRGDPHGKSPHGGTYGVISWDDAMHLPGSAQEAYGKKFFEKLPWTQFVPMPDAVAWADQNAAGPLGDWIWFPEGDPAHDAPVAARFFRRTFELPNGAAIRGAKLRIAADDKFTAWLNGHELGSSANWRSPATFDAAKAIQAGKNVLAVRGENVASDVPANPAGLTARLTVELADGTTTTISSDTVWRASKTEAKGWRESAFDDSTWPAAKIAARFGEGPWGNIDTAATAAPPQACGIPGKLLVLYALQPGVIAVHGLPPNSKCRQTQFDPVTGRSTAAADIEIDAQGTAKIPSPSENHDWVALIEAKN